jgi:hypothetical protein
MNRVRALPAWSLQPLIPLEYTFRGVDLMTLFERGHYKIPRSR